MSDVAIHCGDTLEVLRTLPEGSVNCCVTSPPYWGLRDYGQPGQYGLEKTPDEYVTRMVDVFREVRRVLRPDGTCWVNLGDSYASGGGNTAMTGGKTDPARGVAMGFGSLPKTHTGMGPKQLVGIPWRVAFALQSDGWILRQDIIWAKPNPMPESVRDRCTKAHEYLFLLTKSAKYWFDHGAVKEDAVQGPQVRNRASNFSKASKAGRHGQGAATIELDGGRNKRSVWTVTPKPYKGAHFAVMPPGLVEPCIKAGCPVGGVVLDPFLGSGTTAACALSLGRNAIGIELNPAYVELARKRVGEVSMPLMDGVV